MEMKTLFLTDNSTENTAFGLQLNGLIHFSLLNQTVTPSQSQTLAVWTVQCSAGEKAAHHVHTSQKHTGSK